MARFRLRHSHLAKSSTVFDRILLAFVKYRVFKENRIIFDHDEALVSAKALFNASSWSHSVFSETVPKRACRK